MTRRSRSRRPSAARNAGFIALMLAVLLAGWYWQRTDTPRSADDAMPAPSADNGTQSLPLSLPGLERERATEMREDALPSYLPPEARETMRLIARGGPFPHAQDGSVFGNREGHLPAKPRGYYREYTVATPGLSHRGARRIVSGGQPPQIYYYSDDHYDSFRSFQVPR